MMIEMMIDFETLAVSKDAAVCSLGYAVFNDTEVLKIGGWTINTTSSILVGGVVDPETVEWWKGQSVDAKEAIISGGVPITTAMTGLAEAWERNDCERIWSHGATFDIALAEFYFKGNHPWKYTQIRDTRTLFEEAKIQGWQRPTRDTAHIAVQDAINQAQDVINARRVMRGTAP